MAGPTWTQQPTYSDAKITALATPATPAIAVTYTLELKEGSDWSPSGHKSPAAGAAAVFDITLAETGTEYRVVATGSDGNATTSGLVNVPGRAGPATDAPADPPRYFYARYALVIGILAVLLTIPAALVLFRLAGRLPADKLHDSAVAIAGNIALALLTVGLTLAAAGVYLLAVEHRATMVDRPKNATRGADQVPALLEAYAKVKAPWAVMAAAIGVLVAAAWVGVHIADSAGPNPTPTSTATTTSAPTATTSPTASG